MDILYLIEGGGGGRGRGVMGFIENILFACFNHLFKVDPKI